MYIVVFVTTKNKTEANKIAKQLLEKKMIACANVIDGVSSVFWWQGKIESAKESLLILKTKRSKFRKLASTVKEIHSYSVPEIIALPIVGGSEDYLKWINETTSN